MSILIFLVLGYTLGSIPFGLVLTRLAGYGDIRAIGSGNIGATNVLRTGNKPLALITLLLDSGKGAIAAGLAAALLHYTALSPTSGFSAQSIYIAAALAAVTGHCFPVWLKFKGGKGVATTLGGLLAALPLIGLVCCLTWVVSALLTRTSSLSALIAILAAPIFAQVIYSDPVGITLPCALFTVLIWAKHHQNIKRLLDGTEPKIGKKKQNTTEA
jgi:glycerol-3-phosphate acyltransferase PlsY